MKRIAVVTGSRADFGLLRPVIAAIAAEPELELRLVVTGTHLLPPSFTHETVSAQFDVATRIPMQVAGEVGRDADAAALGRGVSQLAQEFAESHPDVVLVLGDRIEAFAAAAAAAVGGRHVGHIHGGDRAEGVADDAMRHAITKLAHLHFTASPASTERVLAMGEEPRRTFLVGSPALDDLPAMGPVDDATFAELGEPAVLFLLHPSGDDDDVEQERAGALLARCLEIGRVLAVDPNHDPGRVGIVRALDAFPDVTRVPHLPRETFVGLLRRVRMIVGNSSAGLIEAAAIPVRCVNVGPRQSGREKPAHVFNCPTWDIRAIDLALSRAETEPVLSVKHRFGRGDSGRRIAQLLRKVDLAALPVRKQNTY
ncbi:MAG: UDP-N-acetylglucosamine 2-epimerase (hydrolyzing) [Phycisphaerales bacterium]|nr:UDP-N-acetylglucosamine 2-epimerase (hydrolyzing) [Phycisphaerales bacterium]NNM27152.1 UDP-N-acetylglucosamine 2-epimerase (hydrolyzing) [Phycisphaerales bacterium]